MSTAQTQKEMVEKLSKNQLQPLKDTDVIPFKCAMCGKCCNNTDIMLSIYDVYELARGLGKTVQDTLNKYCEVYKGPQSGLPVAIFKDAAVGKCVFQKEGKCSIRDFRPKICRLYPLGAFQMFDKEEIKSGYVLLPDQTCAGFRNGTQTLAEFVRNQGLKKFEEITNFYSKIIFDWNTEFDLTKTYRRGF